MSHTYILRILPHALTRYITETSMYKSLRNRNNGQNLYFSKVQSRTLDYLKEFS